MAYTPSMTRLIQELSKLPGIGEKTAARLAFYVLRADRALADGLAAALVALKDQTRLCSVCNGLTESDPCPICGNGERSDESICVVEEPADLIAIERSKGFRGRYHVLQGALSPLDGVGPEDLSIAKLIERAGAPEVKEVLLALNATVEGQSTAHYLTDQLAGCNVTISRLAHGVPIGGELDYLDEGTLAAAVKARKTM